MDDVEIKEMIRARYGGIAADRDAGRYAPTSSCCGPVHTAQTKSRKMGYSDAELAVVLKVRISASAAAIRRQSP